MGWPRDLTGQIPWEYHSDKDFSFSRLAPGMDNGDSRSDFFENRTQLFTVLSDLSAQDFERLLFALKPPGGLIPGPEAAQMNRVKALLDWAEGPSGRGIDEVQDCFNKLQNATLPAAFDFSGYLQAVCEDDRYRKVHDLYTESEVLIRLEAESVEKKPATADDRREAEPQQKKVERFLVLEGLRKYALGEKRQHLLLAGRPGSGKSTTLKRLLLELADSALGQSEIVPVYVQLKGDRSITDLIMAEFRRAKVRVTPEQLDDWLLQDRLLLLLDGINEIPSDEQRRKLQEFREDNSTTPMIFTTRDLAVGGDLGIQKRLEMRPLSEAQMREFVKQYLPNHADTLLRQLKDRLREIAETPLLLKMLCDVFDPTTGQIPQSKGQLFRLFDAKYDQFKGLAAVSADFRRFKPELLWHLAFCMMQGDSAKPTEAWLTIERNHAEAILEDYLTGRVEAPGQRAKEWLEDLLEHHLLQVATDPREIEFHHQLFQEYYAAEELLLRLPELLKDENTFKRDYLNYLKWTEAIALMLSLVDEEKQALRLVKLAMNEVDLLLGTRLAGQVKPTLRSAVFQVVIPKLRQALSCSGIQDCVKAVKALGEIASDEAIEGLTDAMEDLNVDIRSAASEALMKIGGKRTIPGLLKALQDESISVHWRVAEKLGEICGESDIPELLKILDSPSPGSRRRATVALGGIDIATVIPGLKKASKDRDLSVRNRASEALKKISIRLLLSRNKVEKKFGRIKPNCEYYLD